LASDLLMSRFNSVKPAVSRIRHHNTQKRSHQLTDARSRQGNGAIMLSKGAYVVAGIAIVALSFAATLFVLNLWSGYPTAESPSASPADTRESELADLPTMQGAGFQWTGIAKLNVRAETGASAVTGQPILQLLPTSQDGYHTLGGQFTGLSKNQHYRIAAWLKPEAGANVEVGVADNPNGKALNFAVGVFDLTQHTVLSGSGAVNDRGIEQGPGDWQKVWLDLPTSDGQFIFTIRPANGAAVTFKGDGKFGLILGGIEAAPKS
jgi:hypothetical protein